MRRLALSDDVLLSIEKPARYIGGETNMVEKDPESVDIRFCMCFPDVYEIGMSHLGIQIIYDMLNRRDDVYCERTYSPWPDLHGIMKRENILLFALESQDNVRDFDFLGITLQYEMCYTNVLQILDLSGIALYAAERGMDEPFVIGGGPCAYNPEPVADFFDIFYIGDGETVYFELMDRYKEWKRTGADRTSFLKSAAKIPGIYVPAFYEPGYDINGVLCSFEPTVSEAPAKVLKQTVSDMSDTFYPSKPLVPYVKATQERAVLEIQRGCIRGCRFCQAGMLYRPIRARSLDFLKKKAEEIIKSTGYDEISLSSLSSNDYEKLPELVYWLIERFGGEGVNISLPSLRIDAFALDVMSKVQDVRKSSITFAPEAGTQRMRDAINKGLGEDDILNGAREAFKAGWSRVKLYFMLGLPGETYDDVEGIASLSDKIAGEFYAASNEKRAKRPGIVASTSVFVPKPFTPFQWSSMDTMEQIDGKRDFLLKKINGQPHGKCIKYNCHDAAMSEIEGVLARGDRRLSKVVRRAYESGCIFDAWSEHFRYEKWVKAFEECGLEMEFYTARERGEDELFPWDFIDIGVTKDFLFDEYKKSKAQETTQNCRVKCAGCGAARFKCGICVEDGRGEGQD